MNTRTERHTTPQGFVEVGIITHEGREYASGGAAVSDTHLVCYPKKPIGMGGWPFVFPHGHVTTWNGDVIGTYHVTGYAQGFAGISGDGKLTCYRVRLDDGREVRRPWAGPWHDPQVPACGAEGTVTA